MGGIPEAKPAVQPPAAASPEPLPPPEPLAPELAAEVLRVIGRLDFVFARTMPDNPHEYTIRGKNGDEADFAALWQAVAEHGRVERWGKARYRYLYPGGGWRYWIMPRYPFIINRARVAPPERSGADDPELSRPDGPRSGD